MGQIARIILLSGTIISCTAPVIEFIQDFDDLVAGTVLTDNQVRDAFSMESKFYVKNDGTPGVMIVADPANSGRDKVFQVSWPKGSVKTTGGGAQWVTRITAGDEYYFSYDIYVPAGFNWPLSSKLPGLYGGDLGTVTGGKKGDGVHGFALRQGVVSERKEGDTGGYFYIGDGVLMATPNTYESTGVARYNYALVNKFDGDSARLVPGKWMTLQQRVKLNTATSKASVGYKANGIYEAWVDGVKVFSDRGLGYRIVDSLKIDGISFVWFYGGNGGDFAAREDQAYYFDNFVLSTQPISH